MSENEQKIKNQPKKYKFKVPPQGVDQHINRRLKRDSIHREYQGQLLEFAAHNPTKPPWLDNLLLHKI